MNGVGKELMAQRITDQIKEILLVKNTPPITLALRQEFLDHDQEATVALEK